MSAQALEEKRVALGRPQMTDVEMMAQGTETKVLIAIDGCVFDVSSYVEKHPGGKAVLSRNSGKDMSDSFKKIGHSEKAKLQLAEFYVAELQVTEEGKAMAEAKKQRLAELLQKPGPSEKRGLPISFCGEFLLGANRPPL